MGSRCAGNTSTPSSVYEVELVASTFIVAPSGTPSTFDTTGIPGEPGWAGVSVSGSASFVHVRPPPSASTNRSAGRSTRRRMPFASLWVIVVLTSSNLLGLVPPPQRFVRGPAISARLAASDAGPSARRRLLPRRLRRPFLTLIPRSTRRKVASWRTEVHGLLRALRRATPAAFFSFAFCFLVAADDGS